MLGLVGMSFFWREVLWCEEVERGWEARRGYEFGMEQVTIELMWEVQR